VVIKQQVAQGNGEMTGGDWERFTVRDQAKPCDIRIGLTCSSVRRQAFTYSVVDTMWKVSTWRSQKMGR
jgi:hypothetical protein